MPTIEVAVSVYRLDLTLHTNPFYPDEPIPGSGWGYVWEHKIATGRPFYDFSIQYVMGTHYDGFQLYMCDQYCG